MNKWRAPEDARPTVGLIGPNAILQLLPVLDRFHGRQWRHQLFARAGVFEIPDGSSMVNESDAARIHRQLRLQEPAIAPQLAYAAGIATGDYILEHRIPSPAQIVLKTLPKRLSALMLSRAIAHHAWTFVGSGEFHVLTPTRFSIANNPLVRNEQSETCLCAWHAAVFERLYQILVTPDYRCREVCCCAQPGKSACCFELFRVGKSGEDGL